MSSRVIDHDVPMIRNRRWVIAMIVALTPLVAMPARAHMRGMFATRAEAEQRAAQLNCKGAFAMGTLWMPCANERAFHDALQKEK